MSVKPKKADAQKAASKSSPAPSAAPPSSPAAVAADGARLRRLARAGFEGADRCALLGIELDAEGPRARRWRTPRRLVGDVVVSELGLIIVESEVSPEALERAAARLRERGEV